MTSEAHYLCSGPGPFGRVDMGLEWVEGRGRYCLRILRADPRVLCSTGIMEAAEGGEYPSLRLSGDQDDVLIVADDFGRVVFYRIVQFNPLHDAWILEWPD